MPLVGPNPPTEACFRAAGFTVKALQYPRSEAALRALCAFNGLDLDRHNIPRAWAYYPNEGMREFWAKRLTAETEE